MPHRFDPETVDLDSLREVLEEHCGSFVEGDVVGRTRLRDEVTLHLGCSTLDAERIIDTMVGRGFLQRQTVADGRNGWTTATASR